MLKNYLKIAFRNIIKNKTYSLINVIGLSIGVAGCILILLYVQNELSYDKFNKNYENIYRIGTKLNWNGKTRTSPVTSANLGPALKENFSNVENYVRIFDLSPLKEIIKYRNKSFYNNGLIFADSSFFNVFSYRLLEGNRNNILTAPFTIVITQSIAGKYFGSQDPLGKVIQFETENGKRFKFTISGVMRDPPANSSMQFKFIGSYNTLYTKEWNYPAIKSWGQLSTFTYILLSKKKTAHNLEAKIPAFLKKQPGFEEASKARDFSMFLQPIKDIHLFSHFDFQLQKSTDVKTLYIFSIIAAFLLLIACINFVNLSTARYTKRAKEIGVRKVMGALRTQLIRQFIAESVLMSLIATLIALLLVELTIPFTKDLMGISLKFYLVNNALTPLIILLGAVITGALAGIYPAFFLTSFRPDSILKNNYRSVKSGSLIRKGMVTAQFTISIALIAGTIFVQRQIEYIQNTDLGFNKNNVVVIPLINKNAVSHSQTYCAELLQNPNIVTASPASDFPSEMNMKSAFHKNGNRSEKLWMNKLYIDLSYIKTLGLKIKEGSLPLMPGDKGYILINEAAQKKLGFKNAVGRELIYGKQKLKIAAVIRNYNYLSLHDKITPLVMQITPPSSGFILCRIKPLNYVSTLSYLKNKWTEINKEIPFEYSFLKNDLNKLYMKESKFGVLINIFSGLAILIACLGLLGLSMFNIEQRIKEIGIRKVLGASVPEILKLVTKDFITIILISNIVAWPVAYYFIREWLRNYAYHIAVSWWVFVSAGCIALIIALAAISYQAIRAAVSNPVKSIRYE